MPGSKYVVAKIKLTKTVSSVCVVEEFRDTKKIIPFVLLLLRDYYIVEGSYRYRLEL